MTVKDVPDARIEHPHPERADRLRPLHRLAGRGRGVPPEDPGGAEAQGELEARGKVPFDYGLMWFKGRRMGTGQAPVKRYNRALRDLIASGRAEPGFVVSHELALDEAPSAYEHFDNRDEGWTKVILHPDGHG